MKTFIFAIYKTVQRRMGGRNQTAYIYRMKKNVPIYVGEVKWCTAGYRGDTSEVMNALVKMGHIQKKYYGYSTTEQNDYRIYRVGG